MRSGAGDDEDLIGLGADDEAREPRWMTWWATWWTRRRRVAAGAALIAVACVAAAVARGGQAARNGTSGSGPASASASASPSASGTSVLPDIIGMPSPVPVSETVPESVLLGESGDWELDAFSADAATQYGGGLLTRIQFGTRTVTQTPVPPLDSSGPADLIAGPDEIMIRPLDYVPGYAIPDGGAARPAPDGLGHGGEVFPGPRPGQIWITAGSPTAALLLMNVKGAKSGQTIRIPARDSDSATFTADGQGYVLVQANGVVYDARPSGWRKVAAGTLTAVGRSAWLTSSCGPVTRCVNTVVDPASGASRTLPGSADLAGQNGDVQNGGVPGVISPDGRVAAAASYGTGGLRLLDLRTGAERLVGGKRPGMGWHQIAWSPDSRWLFAATDGGGLRAIDARSGEERYLDITLPPVTILAIRTSH